MFIHNLHEETKSYLKLLLNERRQSAPVSSTGGDKAKKDKKKDEKEKPEDKPEGLPVGAVVELSPTQDFEAMGAQYGVGENDLEKAKKANRQLRGAGPSEFYGKEDENAPAQYGAIESDVPTGSGIGFHPNIKDVTNRSNWGEKKVQEYDPYTSNIPVLFGPSKDNIKSFETNVMQPYKTLQYLKFKKAVASALPGGDVALKTSALMDVIGAGSEIESDFQGAGSASKLARQQARAQRAKDKFYASHEIGFDAKPDADAVQKVSGIAKRYKQFKDVDEIRIALQKIEPENASFFDDVYQMDLKDPSKSLETSRLGQYFLATKGMAKSSILNKSSGNLQSAIKDATEKMVGMGGLDPFYAQELAAKLSGGEWVETMAKDIAPAQQRGVLSSMGSPTAVLGR